MVILPENTRRVRLKSLRVDNRLWVQAFPIPAGPLGEAVGHISIERRRLVQDAGCERDVAALQRALQRRLDAPYVVTSAFVHPQWRSAHLGVALYWAAAMLAAGDQGGAFIMAGACDMDATSASARRVWGSAALHRALAVRGRVAAPRDVPSAPFKVASLRLDEDGFVDLPATRTTANPGSASCVDLSADQRRVLEDLVRRAEESEDDWGTTDAVREYLEEPDEDPVRFLHAVYRDVGWHLGHVGDDEDDEKSAERARASISRAIDDLEMLQRDAPRRVATARRQIDDHRRAIGMPPLDPAAAGWSDDDILAEAARIARNPAGLRRVNPVARTPGVPPISPSDYVRLSAADAAYRRNYVGPGGELMASSRETPASTPDLAVGTWMLDDQMKFPWGHEIYELVEFQPRELEPSEFSWDDPKAELAWAGKWNDAQRYVTWLRRGLRPPPITVVQTWGGTLRVTNGHRRLAAADIAGVPVRGWVSWLVKDPTHGAVGLTYEIATGRDLAAKASLPVRTQVMHIDMFGDQHQYWIVATLPDKDTHYGRMVLSVWRDEVHVDDVWVLPEARRQGVATELYRALHQFAAEEKLDVRHGMLTEEGAAAWAAIRPRLGLPENPRAEMLSW